MGRSPLSPFIAPSSLPFSFPSLPPPFLPFLHSWRVCTGDVLIVGEVAQEGCPGGGRDVSLEQQHVGPDLGPRGPTS